ncbi:MAG: hypothetical protein FWD06_05510 [Oscillospiraceae bacterium]|nr:hypothetical protein [Oscillospiraceae bacterium]
MAKKLLALFLATLMLLGAFAVGATATSDESLMFTEAEALFMLENWTCLEDFVADNAPQRRLWSANEDRIPRGIDRRFDRYMDIFFNLSFLQYLRVAPDVLAALENAQAPIARAETQLQLNRALNTLNNDISRALRNHGELGFFAAFFSWVGGNFWWLWAPIAAAVAAVGAWFIFMA